MLEAERAKALAAQVVEMATKAGADAADAVVAADTSLSISVRLGELEDVSRSEGAELGLRLFVGQRSASVATSDLSDPALAALVERAVAMAKEAPEDRWAGLAPAERLMKGAPPMLDLADPHDPDPQLLRDQALAAEDAARSVAGVTNSEGGGANSGRGVTALATSTGFAGGYEATHFGVSASVLAGTGEGMQRDYAYHSARHHAQLEDAAAIGRRAGERAVARLDPVKLASGAMPVVFDPRVGSSLLGHLLAAISGSAITRKTSFLQDALGKRVFAEGVFVHDDPHRPRGLRSRPFDGEGLPVSPLLLIENGMLESWLLDSAAARQLGLEPTGHAARGIGGPPGVSSSNLYMAAGAASREAVIGDVVRGVYVTEMIGSGINMTTGDYSRGAAGFLIEDGELTRPVAEITVAGNLKDMFLHLTPANDLQFRYGINVPTIRIDGMTVAGG